MRIVSLVPSLTEAVAVTRPELLVGATDYCTHPAGLDVARVGGSKYPDVARVLALRPDVVLMNVEENRERDLFSIREAGIRVYVTYPRTVDAALQELGELMTFLGAGTPDWLHDARNAWNDSTYVEKWRAVIPVWRRPWVVLGSDTFAGDVLRRLGIANVYDTSPDRYPRPTLDEIRATRPEVVVLPDEPYEFTSDDGPEAFPWARYALISGRHLTWYGPSLAQAPTILSRQLAVLSPGD